MDKKIYDNHNDEDLKISALTYAPLSDKQLQHLTNFEKDFNVKNEMDVILLAVQNKAKYLDSFRGY